VSILIITYRINSFNYLTVRRDPTA